MPTYTTWFVQVILYSGNREIKSPGFNSKEEAEAALATIRAAQQGGGWIELDWISVKGDDVLAANLTSSSVGFA